MSRQYRTWRDYLTKCVEESMPSHEPYSLLHTANMVGLFTCIFIKPSQRNRVRKVSTGEIKRGMGGLHGNKVMSPSIAQFNFIIRLTRFRAHWLYASLTTILLYVWSTVT